jgi:transcription antitermination factor NusG
MRATSKRMLFRGSFGARVWCQWGCVRCVRGLAAKVSNRMTNKAKSCFMRNLIRRIMRASWWEATGDGECPVAEHGSSPRPRLTLGRSQMLVLVPHFDFFLDRQTIDRQMGQKCRSGPRPIGAEGENRGDGLSRSASWFRYYAAKKKDEERNNFVEKLHKISRFFRGLVDAKWPQIVTIVVYQLVWNSGEAKSNEWDIGRKQEGSKSFKFDNK